MNAHHPRPPDRRDWRYLGVSLLAVIVTFYCSPLIVRMSNPILVFDAACSRSQTALWSAHYEPKRGLAGRNIGSPEDDGVIRVIRRHPPIFEPAATTSAYRPRKCSVGL
jgi:hypothetical protein